MRMQIEEFEFRPHVRPEELDNLWAQGWRHFGAMFFRYSHTLAGTEIRHVIPLRIDLERFAPSKSQRRVLRKIRGLRQQIAPTELDDERFALFEVHKQRFQDNVPDSLSDFLGPVPNQVPCANQEVALFDGTRLVAASYLDLGARCASSVYGIFDPHDSQRSPGIATMLLEIHYARRLGFRYYYPGYAFREPSHYDYKKQFAGLEVYDWLGHWWPDQLPVHLNSDHEWREQDFSSCEPETDTDLFS